MRRLIIFSIIVISLLIAIEAKARDQKIYLISPNIESVTFDSRKLRTLYQQLNEKQTHTLSDTLIEMDGEIVIQKRLELEIDRQKIPVIIEADQKVTIVHVGVELFARPEYFSQVYIYRAIERLLLELVLNWNQAEDLLKTEGVSVLLDGEPFGSLGFSRISRVLPIMLSAETFSHTWKDFRVVMKCEHDDHLLEWILPAWEELIKGYDKRELDQRLIRQIVENYSSIYGDIRNDDLRLLDNGLWLFPGKEFIKGISTRRYYALNNDQPELAFSEQYPRESVLNFLQKSIKTAPFLKLNLNYNSVPDTVLSISYHRILYALEQQHVIYAGVEEEGNDGYAVVIVFENRAFNHIHLMSLTLPRSIFNVDSITVDARFYPNIRRDNVNTIFSTETVDNKEQKFQIKLK